MMPVPGDKSTHVDSVDYKKKYRTLKRKLKFLVYEHECFLEELRKAQRKLLKVSRDRSFLLDRLLQYEKLDDSSSDSEVTASSDSEAETGRDASAGKKKKHSMNPTPSLFGDVSSILATAGASTAPSSIPMTGLVPSQVPPNVVTKTPEPPKKKAKVTKKLVKPGTAAAQIIQQGNVSVVQIQKQNPMGHMTREELERHLDLKQSSRQQFMSIEKTPHSLPDDIFSNENSNPDSGETVIRIKAESADDTELVIDLPSK